jgi:hypothetical protein
MSRENTKIENQAERRTTRSELDNVRDELNQYLLYEYIGEAGSSDLAEYELSGTGLKSRKVDGVLEGTDSNEYADEYRRYLDNVQYDPEDYENQDFINIDNVPYEYRTAELLVTASLRSPHIIDRLPDTELNSEFITTLADNFPQFVATSFQEGINNFYSCLDNIYEREERSGLILNTLTREQCDKIDAYSALHHELIIDSYFPNAISEYELLEFCSSGFSKPVQIPTELKENTEFLRNLCIVRPQSLLQNQGTYRLFWDIVHSDSESPLTVQTMVSALSSSNQEKFES